ncbi:hypothetical protein [Mycolicibacterium fortuitum]|uniref:hypothetical protein n=1 Tax=Mycolicibacterium fortuitum TaxID=1766 RepID=UPI00262208BE|nr:hypothetical protein [Mycolicibacterium fortuitum]
MPPVMDRKSSRARAEAAWRLRVRGRTWQEIADEVGFKSRHSAFKAVRTFLEKNPPDDIETMRRAVGQVMVETIATVRESMEEAHDAGKHRDVAELGKVILDGLDKRAKLEGLYVAVPQVVDVQVTQTVVEMITDTRAKLQAAIDAEVVPLPEQQEIQR